MAIPSFQEITLPLLGIAADGEVHSLAEARKTLAAHFRLTEAEEAELLPSGRQGRFANRVAWAKVYLERAGVLASPGRGQFQITPRGREILANPPGIIDIRYLERFPDFRDFRSRARAQTAEPGESIEPDTPEETLETAYQSIRARLASELLERVKAASPRFFEQMVVELLLRMGYGRAGGGEAIGKSGDEGIDGVIAEDRLAWKWCTCRPSAGKARWAGPKSRNSWVPSTGKGQGKGSSSPPARSRPKPPAT